MTDFTFILHVHEEDAWMVDIRTPKSGSAYGSLMLASGAVDIVVSSKAQLERLGTAVAGLIALERTAPLR